jgi:plasmid maintenance system antidote protein VapI
MTGAFGNSADMAYRLAAACGSSAELWAGMQLQYDLQQAGTIKHPRIEKLAA